MKKKWLLCGLPLLVLESAIADDCCEPLEPCRPLPCIEDVCYSPVYYNLVCDWGASLSVDFLYWHGKQSRIIHSVVATTENINVGGNYEQLSERSPSWKSFGVKWEPGVRVGLGFNACNGWSANLNWLYYHNKSTSKTTLGPSVNFGRFPGDKSGLLNFGQGHLHGEITNDNRAKWDFDLNRIDLEFGNRYWITECLTVRPSKARSRCPPPKI